MKWTSFWLRLRALHAVSTRLLRRVFRAAPAGIIETRYACLGGSHRVGIDTRTGTLLFYDHARGGLRDFKTLLGLGSPVGCLQATQVFGPGAYVPEEWREIVARAHQIHEARRLGRTDRPEPGFVDRSYRWITALATEALQSRCAYANDVRRYYRVHVGSKVTPAIGASAPAYGIT